MDGTVLVADDDRTIRTVLTQALTRAGCKVHATSSMVTLMRWVEEGKGDLVISDVVMPDGNGIEALPKIAAERPGLPVIVISAQNTIMTAIQAAEAEAYDYLPKPFDLPDLMKRAARALSQKRRVAAPEPAPREGGDDLPLVGRTPAMQALYRLVARVMNADLPVLITGESGAGKSLVARAIHDFSDRRTLPFVIAQAKRSCRGSTGHRQSWTRARGGTIVFDEIGDFDAEAQGRIVRMLDALPATAPRILATSQQDLAAGIEAGALPRGSVLPDRRGHTGGAAAEGSGGGYSASGRSFPGPCGTRRIARAAHGARGDGTDPRLSLAGQCAATGKHAETPCRNRAGARDHRRAEVEAAAWRHACPAAAQGCHRAGRTAFRLHRPPPATLFRSAWRRLPPPGLYDRILKEMELPLIEIALDATGGNQAKCADLLGINRNTLRKKITDLDIRVTRRRKLM